MREVVARLLLPALLLANMGIPASAQVGAAPTPPTTRSVGFTLQREGHIVVRVVVNGQPANLALDTGAAVTLIDHASVERLKLKLEKSRGHRAIGAGAYGMEIRASHGNTLQAGNLRLSGVTLRALDLSHAVYAISTPKLQVHGVLGADILIRHGAIIDYTTKRVTFTK